MRLLPTTGLSSTSKLFILLFLAAHVASQGTSKAPETDDSAAATTGGQSAAATPASKDSDEKPTATKNGKASGTTDAAASSLPKITSAAAATTDAPGLTGLPKLAGDDYPPPSVPPTANAPYMQKSTLPEGTVFIGVGAALGFIGMLVLAWRGMVAWSIHRSVKRAAHAQSSKYGPGRDSRARMANAKSAYFSPAAGSTLSLDHLATSGKDRESKQALAHNSLFFSPTAAGGAGAGTHNPNHRGSAYLPAGYYASGNPAPSGMTHIGGNAAAMSNLTNQNRHSRLSRQPSPPRSPSLPPSRGGDSAYAPRLSTQGLVGHTSTSSINLSAPPEGRAPSAYLEDLFENHPPGEVPLDEPRKSRRT